MSAVCLRNIKAAGRVSLHCTDCPSGDLKNCRSDRTLKWGNVVKQRHKLAAEIEQSPFNYVVPSPGATGVKRAFLKLRAAAERSMSRWQVLMRHRSGRIGFAVAGLCFVFVPSSVALADPENGRRLADRWCSACHVVAPSQQRASADVPPFSTIARTPDFNAQRLTFFLLEPHPRMPSMSLSRKEAADIADYIKQLRDAR